MLGSVFFLTPLYVVDVAKADASVAELLLSVQALALLLTLRVGRSITDRHGWKYAIAAGMFSQAVSIALLGVYRSADLVGLFVVPRCLASNGVNTP